MSHFHRRLQLFSNQPFRNLAVSCLCSNLGYGLSYVVMAWLVLQVADSIQSVAMLMICFWAPMTLLGPLAGVLCDRYSRRIIVALGHALRFVALLGYVLFIQEPNTNLPLFILATIIGIGTCFAGPPTMALVREVVPEKDLLNANVVVDIAYETGNIVGMGVGGLLLALLSTHNILSLNAMWFLVGAWAVWAMQHRAVTVEKSTSFWQDFCDGLSYLLSKRDLCIIYTAQLLLMVGFMTAPILLAPFAKDVMGATASQFGWMEAGLSLGVVLGGLFSPFLAEKFGVYKIALLQTIVLSMSLFAFSYVKTFLPGLCLYFIIGYCYSNWPLLITKAQEMTDIDYQGRTFSTFLSLAGLAVLSIYLLAYFGGEMLSLQKMYWIESAITGTAALLLIVYTKNLYPKTASKDLH